MKATRYINSKGLQKGAYIYKVKKNGERYAEPMFVQFIGSEMTAEEVAERMRRLNPDSKFVTA